MASWGATDFNIRYGTFVPPYSDDSTTIIDILANADDLSDRAQVKQQGGAKLMHTSFVVVEEPPDLTFHAALEQDKNAGTVRTFTGPLGVTMDAIVLSVGRVQYEGMEDSPGALFFPVELVEAEVVSP